jgi:hypothetical protein
MIKGVNSLIKAYDQVLLLYNYLNIAGCKFCVYLKRTSHIKKNSIGIPLKNLNDVRKFILIILNFDYEITFSTSSDKKKKKKKKRRKGNGEEDILSCPIICFALYIAVKVERSLAVSQSQRTNRVSVTANGPR